jgi:hypothetical protein
MTPEERQMLSALSDRIKSAPAQEIDAEADQALRQLAQIRPDSLYLLAQTTLMQDFALRNAQAQIAELQRQVQQQSAPAPQSSGSFLGGLFGSNPPPQSPGSVPSVNPWGRPVQPQPQAYAPPPPQPAYGYAPAPGAPIMQPAQTSGFLRSAATTAAGIAGGALLFEGIQSLFSGHQGFGGMGGGGFMNPAGFGGMGGGYGGQPSLSETTINNYYDGQSPGTAPDQQAADYQPDQGGYQDTDYQTDNSDVGTDFSSDDSGGGSDSI